MEDETKDFLLAIVQTASLIILWGLINVIVGIKMKLGLFDDMPSLKNYLYYIFFLVSGFFLARHLSKKWRSVKKF